MRTLISRLAQKFRLVVGLLLALPAACDTAGPAAPPSPVVSATVIPSAPASVPSASAAKTTISIWHNWQGPAFQQIVSALSDYRKAHPDLAINLQQVPDVLNKLKPAHDAGLGPDIIAGSSTLIGPCIAKGTIQPLDGLGGIDAAYLRANYSPVAQAAVTYQGHIYALPESLENVTLIYNKALIKESDLPTTTTDLVAQAKAYQSTHPGHRYVIWNAKDAYFDAWFFYGAGAAYVTDQGDVSLDTPQAHAAATYLQALSAVLPLDIDYPTATALFKSGQVPIFIDGPWILSDLQAAGLDVGFARLPRVDFGDSGPARPFVVVQGMLLAADNPHAAPAVDMMKYYTNSAVSTRLSQAAGWVPAQGAPPDPALAAFAAQAGDGVPMPNAPWMGAAWTPLSQGMAAIFGGQDVKTALTQTQQAVRAAIAGPK